MSTTNVDFGYVHEDTIPGCRCSSQELECKRRRDLIGSVADTDIEIRKVSLHHIAKNNIQTLFGWSRLKPLGDFSSHARIQFDGDALFRSVQDLCCQIACTRADFEDDLLLLLL